MVNLVDLEIFHAPGWLRTQSATPAADFNRLKIVEGAAHGPDVGKPFWSLGPLNTITGPL